MLQIAFEASCMNRGSAFEWHKRYKECRESVRNDERWACKGVRALAPPWFPEEDMGRRYPLSKYMSLFLSLKQQQIVDPLKNKMRDIFIRKCFVRHYLWLCFRLYLYYSYTTRGLVTENIENCNISERSNDFNSWGKKHCKSEQSKGNFISLRYKDGKIIVRNKIRRINH